MMSDDTEDPVVNINLRTASIPRGRSPSGDPYAAALSRKPFELFDSYLEERKDATATPAEMEGASRQIHGYLPTGLQEATIQRKRTEDEFLDDWSTPIEFENSLSSISGSESRRLPNILRKNMHYTVLPDRKETAKDSSTPYFSTTSGMSTGTKRFETPLSHPETFETVPSQPEQDVARRARERSKLRSLFEENSLSPPRARVTIPPTKARCEETTSETFRSDSKQRVEAETDGFLDETDWCGQGMHVDLKKGERVQLEDLHEVVGHGSTSTVDLVRCRGIKLARKTILLRRNLNLKNVLKEVRALHELRHAHIIRLVGTYTQGRSFNMLLYPVARLNLADFLESFFETVEKHGISQQTSCRKHWREKLSPSSLCLVSAVAFVHSHGIKHMDIKPQNVLLKWTAPTEIPNVWGYKVFLCDFGISHIFEMDNASQTDAYLGKTPRYAAPEVAAEDFHGRDADIFSLGCVLAEMNTVFSKRQLEDFSIYRHDGNGAHLAGKSDGAKAVVFTKPYHETIDQSQAWVQQLSDMEIQRDIIRLMLEKDPSQRPKLCPGLREVGQLDENAIPFEDTPDGQHFEGHKVLNMRCPHDSMGPELYVYDNSDGTDTCEEFSTDMLLLERV